ncbi:response regulator [Chitinispirillales bacterium ANBcel5]|uniref:T9SS response regulator signal transducer PorX n=1 Tax=Cellulosispirillum alkaliphilum TaxID=3039283 RepID=UPI002A5071B6|nr:response regulator [Chitinispirillales bacterium ANBcel5]
MSTSRKKILWVDDEIEFFRAHISYLETRGYYVIPAFNGDDAIEKIKNDPDFFDIVFIDKLMPGKDGLATHSEIKKISFTTPVVLLINRATDKKEIARSLETKISAFVTKPVGCSRLLSVLKNLFDKKETDTRHIVETFLRDYTQIKNLLSASSLDYAGYIKLYQSLNRWSIKLDKVDNEELRQMHAGQVSDCNMHFSNFVSEQYVRWVSGCSKKPLLSNDVMKKVVVPKLIKKQQVILIVLSGMRMDQFVLMESWLKKALSYKKRYFFSVLPSSFQYSHRSLLSGLLPAEHSAACMGSSVMDSLKLGLKKHCDCEPAAKHIDASGKNNYSSLISQVNRDTRSFIVITSDIMEHLKSNKGTSKTFEDDSTLREQTCEWVAQSSIVDFIKGISNESREVILTSDHGHVYSTRCTEIYGTDELPENRRYFTGERISSDERNALYISEPEQYALPNTSPQCKWLIARENFCFTKPGKFEMSLQQSRFSFQQGGISMEEMIMPLYICSPK